MQNTILIYKGYLVKTNDLYLTELNNTVLYLNNRVTEKHQQQ